MAQTAWHSSTLPSTLPPLLLPQPDNASHTGRHGHPSVAPRPIPPPSDLSRWDLADLLNPPDPRDRKMSLDFSPSPQHNLYPQSDIDQPYHLHPGDSPTHTQPHPFDNSEPMDTPEHPSYDIFPGPSSGSFSSHRYRTNASSSSSLGPNYGMNSEGLYSHSSFGDSVPSFGGSNGNPYDMINSLPSSYGSGKVSPLTPNDPAGGLHHSSGFPSHGAKDFPPQNYSDMADRRLPTISSGGYPSDLIEEYGIGNMSGNLPFQPSTLQHFQDRLPRFSPEGRFHPSGPPTTVPSHGPSGHGSDILRGIPPNATHSFREGGVSGYDDMPHYLGSSPHQDLSLRMPTVDETLARMKLQGHSIMGASNDLQTFIR